MEILHKYTTAETSIKILENRKIRYSKPTQFNDPFDCNTSLLIEDSESLSERVAKIFIPQINDFLQYSANLINEKLREVYKNSYILCLSEVFDNILMWSHYSDNHTGVVLSLKKVTGIDNLLIAEQKVEYCDNFPSLFNKKGSFLNPNSFEAGKEISNKFLLTKAKDWSYEKEHRIICPESKDYGDTRDYNLHIQELDCIYLGCKISDHNKLHLIDLIKNKYKNTKIYEMKMSNTSFKLSKNRIY